MKRIAALALMTLAGAAVAGTADSIPTCYVSSLPAARTAPESELFVAIDQTTQLDGPLKQLVADNIRPFLQPGRAFTIASFSAYTQGRYTTVLAGGTLDALLTDKQRNDISKPSLLKFDHCTRRQPQLAAQLVGKSLRTAYAGTSTDITKSDVLASLKSISALVRGSKASNRVVLIVSDMLENSSVSNFYADKGVRRIDPKKEMQLAEENRLMADFGGARVYVIGAGLLADGAKAKAYRDPKTMNALADFWSAYLVKSNAQLVEFGQPALLRPIE